MGTYLAVIGLADVTYSTDYMYYDESWKTGDVCRVAGFLFVMAKMAATFSLMLIMVERLLALKVGKDKVLRMCSFL